MTRAPRITDQDELPAPRVAVDSATVLAEAIESLSQLRTPYWLGDAGVRLHALASLLAETQQLLPMLVQHARDQELSWTDISPPLGIQPGDRPPPLPTITQVINLTRITHRLTAMFCRRATTTMPPAGLIAPAQRRTCSE